MALYYIKEGIIRNTWLKTLFLEYYVEGLALNIKTSTNYYAYWLVELTKKHDHFKRTLSEIIH
jgi:hypothetical protein